MMNKNDLIQQCTSKEEIKDFLINKTLSANLEIKLKKIIEQDYSITKIEALEILLDYEERLNSKRN